MKKDEIVDYDITYQGLIRKLAELYGEYDRTDLALQDIEEDIDRVLSKVQEFYPLNDIVHDVIKVYKEL